MHLRTHVIQDIKEKGASRNMSTKPYEKMHGKYKKIYQNQTNFKDTASQVSCLACSLALINLINTQILRIEHSLLVSTVISRQIAHFDEMNRGTQVQDRTENASAIKSTRFPLSFRNSSAGALSGVGLLDEEYFERLELGSRVDMLSFADLERQEVENPIFKGLNIRLGNFLSETLPLYGFNLERKRVLCPKTEMVSIPVCLRYYNVHLPV